ncbi:MAG: hypothetical protein BV459_03110, partial [Thermoplasmata archaeon M11B2D]
NTSIPNDLVRVHADIHVTSGENTMNYTIGQDLIVTSPSTNGSLNISIPDCIHDGNFSVTVHVFNSTGRIDYLASLHEIVHYDDSSETGVFHLYHPLGYTKIGNISKCVNGNISGSVFTANEYGRANNITAFIDQTLPVSYTCMLYRASDNALIGTTSSDWVSLPQGDPASTMWWAVFNFTGTAPLLVKGTQYVITCWGGSTSSRVYYHESGWSVSGRYDNNQPYGDPPDPMSFTNEPRYYSLYCSYTPDTTPPQITSVNANPPAVGFGYNITITVNVTDECSGINHVKVQIGYPGGKSGNFTMTHCSNDTYHYLFTDTWLVGQYNYTIWVTDNSSNSNSSSGHHFHVCANASISITTLSDSYTGTEYINLTDPPGSPSPSLGHELLDDGAVLHLWNQYDNYYFNTSSGIQLTNHKTQYWSHNVLMLGYYNNDQWNLLYRTDELTGFTQEIDTDDISFVNVTLWKDLTHAGYSFRLAIRYHLGAGDTDLTVIPSIKNIGSSSIPYVLGFGWELKDIQINMTTQGDYILVDQDTYLLNQTLDNSYTSLNDTVLYLMEDVTGSQTQSLYLRWNPNLNYKLLVKSRSGQQNAPVTLFIRIGMLVAGQQKHTWLQWYDASQETFYFNGFDENEAWESDPELMTDENEETFASTYTDATVEFCNGNTCEGDDLGVILKVELRVNGYYQGKDGGNIIVRPIFGETDGENYTFVTTDQPEWSQWFDITNDDGRGSGGELQWSWSEVEGLDCDVEASRGSETALYCSMIQLRVTYNTAPSVSDPYPPHGTNGIILQPQVNITVSDPNCDTMNVTWYSNSTSSLLTLRPNGNGSITQLSKYPGSTMANYQCVDEAVANDADYVYWSGTTWKKDTYTLEDHGDASGVIHAVTVYARCNRGGIGGYPSVPNQGKIVIKSGGGYYDGNECTPTSTFTLYSHTWSVNPATGAAWDWSAVDALEAGVAFIGNEAGDCRCSQVYVVVTYVNPSTWLQFGSNSSVCNGVYRQRFLNASVNGQWWYWKVKADDGTLSTWSSVYKFYTGYQSKIENTGETDISGYLLMQVQYYNETLESWIVDNDTINETTSRSINSSCQLGLDTIFNGQVRASDLMNGPGLYRVHAAFRDPEGNILNTSDQTKLEAWWQFSKT